METLNPLLHDFSRLGCYGHTAGEAERDIYYYHSDHMGSTSYITDRDANVSQFVGYLPYGKVLLEEHATGTWETPYKFNGKEIDQETGLYYYGARYYDPSIAIWYGVDPLAEKYPEYGGYLYCAANPVKYVDPDGRRIVFARGTTTNQKRQFYQAVRHLDAHNAGGRYGQLKKSRIPYTIKISDNMDSNINFNIATQTILWSPTIGIETENGTIMSPTTVLNHELAHATNYDNARNEYDANYYKDPAAALKKWNEYVESLINHDGNPRGSAEEQSVITRIEQRTAKLLGEINEGEVTRTNHTDGTKVRVESPISNIKIEE